MTFEEFQNNLIKRCGKGKKTFRASGSWGVYDAYKAIRKKGWGRIERPLKEGEFYNIIRSVNNLIAESVANGETIVFPNKMGKLELRKEKKGVEMYGDKIYISYPVDWPKTHRLWYEDPEAYKNKVLVRNEIPYMYKVHYNKHDAMYANMLFYHFTLNRNIKRALCCNIKNNKIDALW